MKFKMNDRNWTIEEKEQQEIKDIMIQHGDKIDSGRYFGITYMDDNSIYLDKDICQEQKNRTLKHELMHCYIACYISNGIESYDEEMLCNISANSHDIIHKIVEDYFKEGNK